MNTQSEATAPAPVRNSVAGFIVGVVALVIVTAVLTAAFSSSSADDKLNKVTQRLEAVARAQEQAEKTDAEQQQATLQARQRNVAYQHEVMRQNRLLRRQLVVVTRILRKNGIDVPLLPPVSRASADPKASAPHSRNPGSPAPTGRSPRNPRATPSPDLCLLLPAFCVGLE